MQRILMTGASSFLGNNVARKLMTKDYEVHLLAREGTDPKKLPPTIPKNQRHLIDSNYRTVEVAVKSVNPDAIFHLAGHYIREPFIDQIDDLIDSNLRLGIHLLEALSKLEQPKFIINIGTYSQYFNSQIAQPLDLYSALKQAFFELLNYYEEAHKIRSTTLIIYDSYGPDDWRHKVINALKNAISGGTPLPLSMPNIVIDLTHIEDVAEAVIHSWNYLLAGKLRDDGRVYCVSGERLTMKNLVKLFEELTNKEIAVQWGKYKLPERKIIEPFLGKQLPGWRPLIPLKSGLRDLIGRQV